MSPEGKKNSFRLVDSAMKRIKKKEEVQIEINLSRTHPNLPSHPRPQSRLEEETGHTWK